MLTIWKFPLKERGLQTVSAPTGATFIAAKMQFGRLCLWASVDPDKPPREYAVTITITGGEVPEDADYIDSAIVAGGDGVFHVFVSR